MSSNFLQWNPAQTNQENDAAYLADSQRSGGASSGSTFASPLANKLFFQISTFIAALAGMLANKGYTTSDADLATLEAVLANLITDADLTAGFAFAATSPGYIVLPTLLGGLIIQWGTSSVAPSSTLAVTLPMAYPNAQLAAVASWDAIGITTAPVGITPTSQTQITLRNNESGFTLGCWWFSIGY